MLPAVTKTGIEVMSLNLLVDEETKPVVWRGPVIAGTVQKFLTDVVWNEVDYMFVDMPPGTGDVPLTVFQSLPVDGIVIVTSPQDLVSMIVAKAVKMANMMHIPVLGFVENYAYLRCPDCGKKINVFGPSHPDEVAKKFDLPVLARLPIDPAVAEAFDNGLMETVNTDALAEVVNAIK
jgi:Mrp family chromosome partitioning ATPase